VILNLTLLSLAALIFHKNGFTAEAHVLDAIYTGPAQRLYPPYDHFTVKP